MKFIKSLILLITIVALLFINNVNSEELRESERGDKFPELYVGPIYKECLNCIDIGCERQNKRCKLLVNKYAESVNCKEQRHSKTLGYGECCPYSPTCYSIN